MCHGNDGIIFTLNNAPVETGTSASILKWKTSHSIDVLVRNVDGHIRIYGNMNHSGDVHDATGAIAGLYTHLVRNKLMEAVSARMPCILECLITIDGDTLNLVPERSARTKHRRIR